MLFDPQFFALGKPGLTRVSQTYVDHMWVEKSGLPSLFLMEQAAAAAFHFFYHQIFSHSASETQRILVVCGFGNNAGDGWALARQLAALDVPLCVLDLAPDKTLSPDAEAMRQAALQFSVPVRALREAEDVRFIHQFQPDFVIDAIFGTGFQADRPASTFLLELVQELVLLRQQGGKVISLDLPSGVVCDSGQVSEATVTADYTLSFVLPKQGLFLMPAAAYAGEVVPLPIGIPLTGDWGSGVEDRVRQISRELVQKLIPTRLANSHKGSYGRGLLLAGSPAMPGGLFLAIEAALRSGLGYLYVVTDEVSRNRAIAAFPEALYPQPDSDEAWMRLLAQVEVIAVGPAWGLSASHGELLERLLNSDKPIILDADALNLLAQSYAPEDLRVRLAERAEKRGEGSVLLTPHPGEFLRLAPDLTGLYREDPLAAARTFAAHSRSLLLLKGARSLLVLPDGRVLVSPTSCSGLARAGSGDVLTGLILSLCSQGLTLPYAATVGIYLQVQTARLLAGGDTAGERAMRVPDLASLFPRVFRELERPS